MLWKSFVVLTSLQMLVLTTLDATSVHALPTGEPLFKCGSSPPSGDYSPQWQQYFQVKDPLPGINFTLGNNYAGNIAVQRPQYPDDSLFFWGFEQSPGSLTAPANRSNNKPWAVWLQGGPGYSSMFGLFSENGPISLRPNSRQLSQNPYAWNNLIDYIWVDQPVGVGFSVANASGYAADEDQVGADFVGFLENLVKVFPSLATRPFYLTGESYAGRYIPYIAKALFSSPKPPVNLAKLAVGDPAFGAVSEFKTMPTLRLIETYPQVIGYDTEVFDYFKQQTHLCGLDLNLSYPQTGGHFARTRLVPGAKPGLVASNNNDGETPFVPDNTRQTAPVSSQAFTSEVRSRHAKRGVQGLTTNHEKREQQHAVWKMAATPTSNTINSWYGCYLWDEMVDYALNFTYPWNVSQAYNAFDVTNDLNPRAARNPGFFMNDARVKAALHAPSKDWLQYIDYPWGSVPNRSDPSPEPMTFFDQLAANASARGVKIITYVGNDDGLSPHFGTEVTIQNTTFGGIQGFTRQPSTPWFDDNGQWAGIVHQERNWTYALVTGAGHEVPGDRPPAAYTFLREFIVGNNQTGLVVQSGGSVAVVGGENPTLRQSAIPGQPGIAYGSKTTQGVYTYPTATVQAFQRHVGLVPITGTNAVKPTAVAAR